MITLSWIRFILAAICLIGGLIFYAIELIGVFRFKYVLSRIHAAAIGDTMGIGLFILGALLLNGWNLTSLKIIAVLVIFWLTSPVSAHMLAKLEVLSRPRPEDCCRVVRVGEKIHGTHYAEQHGLDPSAARDIIREASLQSAESDPAQITLHEEV